MLAWLALIIFCSVEMSSERKDITQQYTYQAAADSTGGTNAMSKQQQQRLRQSLKAESSGYQTEIYEIAALGGDLVSLFIFSTAVSSEIRKGTIRLTLSKPLSRDQFLLGKYLGGVLVMAGYALMMALALVTFAHIQSFSLNPAIKWAPWLMFCGQLMLGSVAMLLSLLVHPLVAAVLSFFSGNSFYSEHNPLYYILPSYRDFRIFSQVYYSSLINWKNVLFLSLYALDFVIIMLLLALWRFRAKELV